MKELRGLTKRAFTLEDEEALVTRAVLLGARIQHMPDYFFGKGEGKKDGWVMSSADKTRMVSSATHHARIEAAWWYLWYRGFAVNGDLSMMEVDPDAIPVAAFWRKFRFED